MSYIDELREAGEFFQEGAKAWDIEGTNPHSITLVKGAQHLITILEAVENGAKLVDGWRDISSAPEDQFLAMVVDAYGHKHVVNVVSENGSYWEVYDDGEALCHRPLEDQFVTHWQPLPDAAPCKIKEIMEGEL